MAETTRRTHSKINPEREAIEMTGEVIDMTDMTDMTEMTGMTGMIDHPDRTQLVTVGIGLVMHCQL